MHSAANEFAISVPAIFDGEKVLADHCVIVREKQVAELLPAGQCPAGISRLVLDAGILAPGLIDLQVNGGGGQMFNNDPSTATLATMRAAHRAVGTTAMLPTLMSDTPQKLRAGIAAIRASRDSGDTGILGVHLEGPFFNPAKRGAHEARMIRPPQPEDIDWLCNLQDLRVLLTLAPEQMQATALARLADSGIVLCAGHTDANYQQIQSAATQGLRGITHLFNAMRPASAREPGTVGAALDDDRLWAGIIADGHHVHPANLRLAYRAKPRGKLLLVSDAMALAGSSATSFELYGNTVREQQGRLVNQEGVLAGSAIALIQAVAYANKTAGLPLDECLRMASLYPATVLGLDHTLGRIAAGYRADLLHFDDQFRVHNTWQAGQRQQHRGRQLP